MKFVLLVLWCAYFVPFPEVKGFFSYCDRNETLFIIEGSSAQFSAEKQRPHLFPRLDKYNRTRHRIFDALLPADISDIRFRDPWVENRTKITGELRNFTVTIHDVEKADNGTYVLHFRDTICFVLYVIGIDKQLAGPIKEHSPAYFYAYPKASVINRPIINATMMWLVDGKNITQSPLFVIQDGMIWLASVSRTLDGRNVTYRALQDNGIVTEVNYTIDVLWQTTDDLVGPEAPLEISPDTEHYFLTSGQVMPDVSCSVECNPPCKVSWDTQGKGSILSLGKVSTSLTGTYTCTATRPGTNTFVKRRLVVQVEDTSAFTIAVAVLASIQAVTTTILVIFGIFIFRKSNAGSKSSNPRFTSSRNTLCDHEIEGNDINETALEHYEELDSEGRNEQQLKQYEKVQAPGTGKTAENIYVNTKIA